MCVNSFYLTLRPPDTSLWLIKGYTSSYMLILIQIFVLGSHTNQCMFNQIAYFVYFKIKSKKTWNTKYIVLMQVMSQGCLTVILHIFKGCFLKMSSGSDPENLHISSIYIHQQFQIYSHRIFYHHISFATWFIDGFSSKNTAKTVFFLMDVESTPLTLMCRLNETRILHLVAFNVHMSIVEMNANKCIFNQAVPRLHI